MTCPISIQAFESISAVGFNAELQALLFEATPTALTWQEHIAHRPFWFGKIDDRKLVSHEEIKRVFPSIGNGPLGRSNFLIAQCLIRMKPAIDEAILRYGHQRIGVVLGASVSGMTEMEKVFADSEKLHEVTDEILEIANPSKFVSQLLNITGPAYVISTACSSSAKALASAARLLRSQIVDAVICGGIDSCSAFTLAGFDSLGALSHGRCQPFGEHRDGINLGEGGALFLLTREPSDFELAGWAETSDGYHISSPDPEAIAVKAAMQKALSMAKLSSVDYINAHGTGTEHNDAMESLAISQTFGSDTPWVSSTKSLTGHTLGGAGALEAAISLMALKENRIPLHRLDSPIDPTLPAIRLALAPKCQSLKTAMSNSLAFGGINAVLILRKTA